MQRGRGCFPRPPCQVFRNHLVFPESAGIFQRFKMCRWIECPENEPADLDAMCGHLMCSQDIEDNGSAGSRSKIQSVCSGNHTHSSITCDLSAIPQCVSALLAKWTEHVGISRWGNIIQTTPLSLQRLSCQPRRPSLVSVLCDSLRPRAHLRDGLKSACPLKCV